MISGVRLENANAFTSLQRQNRAGRSSNKETVEERISSTRIKAVHYSVAIGVSCWRHNEKLSNALHKGRTAANTSVSQDRSARQTERLCQRRTCTGKGVATTTDTTRDSFASREIALIRSKEERFIVLDWTTQSTTESVFSEWTSYTSIGKTSEFAAKAVAGKESKIPSLTIIQVVRCVQG